MSWQDDSRNLLRTICGDVGPLYEYDDTRLDDLILNAAKLVLADTGLDTTYTLTLDTASISPDPVGDNWFISLLVLKSWEILSFNEYRVASNKAMSIRDGPSSVDGRGIAENKKMIAQKAKDDYEGSLVNYNSSQSSHGCGIVSPFRVYNNSENRMFD